jgi:hypothetical protein
MDTRNNFICSREGLADFWFWNDCQHKRVPYTTRR